VTKKSWVPGFGLSHEGLVADSQTRAELSGHLSGVLTPDSPATVSDDTSWTALTAIAGAAYCMMEPQAMEAAEADASTAVLSSAVAVGLKLDAREVAPEWESRTGRILPAAPGPLQSRYLRTHARPHCQRAHTHTLRSRNIADFFVHKFPLSSGLQKIITSAPGGGVRGGAGAGGCERPERLPCISEHGHAQYRARSMKIVPYATLSQQGQCQQRRRGSQSESRDHLKL